MLHSLEMVTTMGKVIGSDRQVSSQNAESTNHYWEVLKRALDVSNVHPTKLFLEGCSRKFTDDEIKDFLAKQEYPLPESYIIRRFLLDGASIEVTEDEHLFKEQGKVYGDLSNVYSAVEGDSNSLRVLDTVDRLIELYLTLDELDDLRDTAVARHIDDGLENGETGILFIGSSHDVVSRLPQDIVIEGLDELHEFDELFAEIKGEPMYGKGEGKR